MPTKRILVMGLGLLCAVGVLVLGTSSGTASRVFGAALASVSFFADMAAGYDIPGAANKAGVLFTSTPHSASTTEAPLPATSPPPPAVDTQRVAQDVAPEVVVPVRIPREGSGGGEAHAQRPAVLFQGAPPSPPAAQSIPWSAPPPSAAEAPPPAKAPVHRARPTSEDDIDNIPPLDCRVNKCNPR